MRETSHGEGGFLETGSRCDAAKKLIPCAG